MKEKCKARSPFRFGVLETTLIRAKKPALHGESLLLLCALQLILLSFVTFAFVDALNDI